MSLPKSYQPYSIIEKEKDKKKEVIRLLNKLKTIEQKIIDSGNAFYVNIKEKNLIVMVNKKGYKNMTDEEITKEITERHLKKSWIGYGY